MNADNRYLIVGLGNPGRDYENTRHNIGFEVIRRLAGRLDVRLEKTAGPVRLGWGTHRGSQVGLATPLTFMNRSGSSVRGLLEQNDLSINQLLVVVDDLNLELGAIRLRPDGSAGGHNGVQDIIDRLGTNTFPRLRIGIGNEFPPGGQVDYVLAPFTRSQQPVVEETLGAAAQAALVFAADGLEAAMNRFNRRSG